MKQDLFDEASQDLKARRNADAVRKFQEVVSRDPNNGLGYQGLAQGLSRLGRYEEAEQASRRALELDPDLAIPHEVLAFIFAQRGHYAESRSEADAAIRLDPNAASAFGTLGFLNMMEGRLQSAEEAFKRAAVINPRNGMVHYDLAICYSRQKRFSESLHEAWTAWRLAPSRKTGRVVAWALLARYRWVLILFWLLTGLILLRGRSFAALPLAAIIVTLHLLGGIAQFRSGDRWGAARSLVSALFWIGLYVYTQVR